MAGKSQFNTEVLHNPRYGRSQPLVDLIQCIPESHYTSIVLFAVSRRAILNSPQENENEIFCDIPIKAYIIPLEWKGNKLCLKCNTVNQSVMVVMSWDVELSLTQRNKKKNNMDKFNITKKINVAL